jgi:hypothetical protein
MSFFEAAYREAENVFFCIMAIVVYSAGNWRNLLFVFAFHGQPQNTYP